MKKRLCIIVLLSLISACGSFNKGTAELHINKDNSYYSLITPLM